MKYLLLLLIFAWPGLAHAADPIGSVTRLIGTADATLASDTRRLDSGAPVHLDEAIITGAGARLELTFADDTKLTLGENARVVLDRFVFDPSGANAFHASVSGAFRYASGKLRDGATRDASIDTPFALIGVRGTDFWGGPLEGRFGVFLIEGQVRVVADGREVVMDTSGQGVDIEAAGSPPGEIIVWGQAKIDRALAGVTFP